MDRDTKTLTEAYENLYSGIVEDDHVKEDDSDDKEESSEKSDKKKKFGFEKKDDSDDKEEKDETEESENDESDDSEEEEDEENPSHESEESDEEESEERESGEEDESEESEEGEESDESGSPEGDSGIQNKVKALQKQYNDILVDAFEKYAPECIQCALDETEGAFGEDIEVILDAALKSLKDRILDDLGVEPAGVDAMQIGPMTTMGMGSTLGGEEEPSIGTIEFGGDESGESEGEESNGSEESEESDEDEEVEEVEEGIEKPTRAQKMVQLRKQNSKEAVKLVKKK